MRKVTKGEIEVKDDAMDESLDESMDECYSIAESIMDEISLINLADRKVEGINCHDMGKGSLKKLMRQIKQARLTSII